MTDVIKLSKKAFTWAVVTLTIVWSMGLAAVAAPLAAQAAECPELEPGDNIQFEGSKSVFVLNDLLERVAYPHVSYYETWNGSSFANVHVLSTSCGEVYPPATELPLSVNPAPGTLLVKTTSLPDVYAVLPGNCRAHIASEEVAKALYGNNWGSKVVDMNDVWFASLSCSEDALTEAIPHEGMVISTEAGGTQYLVQDGMLVEVDGTVTYAQVVSEEVFNSYDVEEDSTVTPAEVRENPVQANFEDNGNGDGDGEEVASGNLSVALDASTPASTYALKSSTHVPFTKVRLTAGSEEVKVQSMKVRRTGSPASDTAFSGVNILLPNGQLLSSSYKTLNSDHEVTFTEDVTVPANSSVVLTIVGKIGTAASQGGEVPRLALVAVETAADVSGTLPIEGSAMTINNTITIGTLTVSESPDLGTTTEEVGTENVEFLNVKLANDSANADIRLDSIRFNNAGSASDADVDNLELVVDGNVIATADMVGNYVYFNLAVCAVCNLEDGKNETYQLRGDIVGGSGRTLDFDIKRADDIVAKDLLNSVYVTPSAAIDSGRTITISRGTLNISKTNTVQAGNIPESTNDLELGSWNFKVAGESLTVSSIKFDIEVGGAGGTLQAADFTNLKLVDKKTGRSLTGATDGTGAGDGSVTFTDSFTLPIGDNDLVIKGNLNADATTNDTVQFAVDFTAAANLDADGDVTGDTITVGTYAFPAAEVDANQLTVTSVALSVTTLGQPAAKTIAAGTAGHQYATVRFDASGSSEDVKVTAFDFEIVTGAVAKTNELQNITFVVGDKTLSITKNGSDTDAGDDEEVVVSLSGDDQFVIKKGTSVTMKIYADLTAGATAGATGTHRIQISSAGNANTVTAQGTPSGNDMTESISSATSNNMTVGTAGGTVEVSLASDSRVTANLAAGTEVDLASYKFFATSTEDVELDYLYLTQVVTTAASSTYTDYDEIWFVNEAGVEVPGTRMTPTSTMPRIDFADDAFVVNISDVDGEVLTLRAKLAAIGTGFSGVSGHYLGYKINAAADVVAKGDLSGNATTEYLSSSAAPTGKTHYVYKSYPSITKVALSSNQLANGTRDLYKFTVTAVNADLDLFKFTFDVATTSVTGTNFYVYDVTDGQELQVNETAASAANGVVEIAGGADWDTSYSSGAITVSKTKPRTFVLRANLANAASGSSISVGLAGDAAHLAFPDANSLMASSTIVDTDANDDFIWSDRNDGAHSRDTDDWTNGYLVPGLPSTTSSLETLSL